LPPLRHPPSISNIPDRRRTPVYLIEPGLITVFIDVK
jgi:hypothetical protein